MFLDITITMKFINYITIMELLLCLSLIIGKLKIYVFIRW